MNLVRALILICFAAGSYAYWKHHHPSPRQLAAQGQTAPGEFVSLPPVEGQRPRTVFVVAAENCPHEDAQRADRLAEALAQKGIPVERSHRVEFQFTSQPDAATVESIKKIMNGPLPAVFVNGRAKSNPSPEEVDVEFRQATQ
jgi:hypothetical protein